MPKRFTIGSIELNATFAAPSSSRRIDDDTPFRMLVMGNFGGRAAAARAPLKPMRIDLDNQDAVLARLNVSADIPFDGPSAPALSLAFKSLEDFHPDLLLSRIPWFQNVLNLRRQLNDPKTFESAAAELSRCTDLTQRSSTSDETASTAPCTASTSPPSETTGDMLERLLGKPATGEPSVAASPSPAQSAVQKIMREAVGGSAVPSGDPRQAELAAAVDRLLAERLNFILHHPDFQTVEATWRGVDFLIKNLELDESLQLYLLDLPRETLMEDLSTADDLRSTRFHEGVVAPVLHDGEAPPWALWVGQYLFENRSEDLSLLAALSQLAATAGAPFLAGMHTGFVEVSAQAEGSVAAPEFEDWNALRRLPQAKYLGLALPRLLGRLPYGPKTDPIDAFDFTEIPGTPPPGEYLWFNGALACACLLGQSFKQCGWNLRTSLLNEIEGLPLHVYQEDGEAKMTPCAEVWLNDQNSEQLLDTGLIPVQSVQRRDAVRVPRFQSIHDPLAPLAGRWT